MSSVPLSEETIPTEVRAKNFSTKGFISTAFVLTLSIALKLPFIFHLRTFVDSQIIRRHKLNKTMLFMLLCNGFSQIIQSLEISLSGVSLNQHRLQQLHLQVRQQRGKLLQGLASPAGGAANRGKLQIRSQRVCQERSVDGAAG